MNSIHDLIVKYLQAGQLVAVQSVGPSAMKDWSKILNVEKRRTTDDTVLAVISNSLLYISCNCTSRATELFNSLLDRYDAIDLMEDMERAIIKYRNEISYSDIYEYVFDILENSDRFELIKTALVITENCLTVKRDDRCIIENLSWCEGMSWYCFRIMSLWNHGNERIFEIGRNLHFWGKTAAVYALDYDSSEIRNWISTSAVRDPLMLPSYAIHLYYRLDIFEELAEKVDECRLYDICFMISTMLNNSICQIDQIDEHEQLIIRFLRQCEERELNVIVYETIYDICEFYQDINEEIVLFCQKLMHQKDAVRKSETAICRYGFYNIASENTILNSETVISLLKRNFKEYFSALNSLTDKKNSEQIISIFRENISFDSLDSDVSLVTVQIMTILNYLKSFPGKGKDIVEKALNCQIEQIRLFSVNTLIEWCLIEEMELDETDSEMLKTVNELLSSEKNDYIREMMLTLSEGRVLEKRDKVSINGKCLS